ncbi:MAG: class I SAM-dependent methyltransferase [Gammaproteobacteria bacterium]
MNPRQAPPEARFWDRIADRYAAKPVPDQQVYETKLAKTDAYLEPTDHVLEIGCGTGTTAIHHAPRVAAIRATDLSPAMIDIARSKARAAQVSNIEFEVVDVDRVRAAPASVDVVLAHSILHLLADVPGALGRLNAMLKPGGLLIASTMMIGDFMPLLRYVAPLGRALGVIPYVNVFKEAQFASWLNAAGFREVERWQPAPKRGVYTVAEKAGAPRAPA